MSEKTDLQPIDVIYFDIIKFLSEYEKHPCLWDRSHEHFKSRRERVQAEESLGEELGIHDLRTLRKKIRSVRGTYNTEIRKIKTSLDSKSEVYVPRLSWFAKADRFLRVTTELPLELEIPVTGCESPPRLQRLPKRKSYTVFMVQSNKEGENGEDDNDVDETVDPDEEKEILDEELKEEVLEVDDDDDESIELRYDSESMSNEDNNFEAVDYESTREQSNHNMSPLKQRDRKRLRPSESHETLSADVVRSLKDIHEASVNEFAAFGKSIGVQLQNMPLELAIQLQMDIQARITRTRLEYLMKRKKISNDETGFEE